MEIFSFRLDHRIYLILTKWNFFWSEKERGSDRWDDILSAHFLLFWSSYMLLYKMYSILFPPYSISTVNTPVEPLSVCFITNSLIGQHRCYCWASINWKRLDFIILFMSVSFVGWWNTLFLFTFYRFDRKDAASQIVLFYN